MPKKTVVISVNAWGYGSIGRSMKGRYQPDLCEWESQGGSYYNVTFHEWPWPDCEETTPRQWLEYAGCQILMVSEKVQVEMQWATPSTREQENAWFERVERKLADQTVIID